MISKASTSLTHFMLIGITLLVAGCSNVSRFQMPGTDLSHVQTLYIRPFDEREAVKLRSLIEENLRQRGFEIAVNEETIEGAGGGFIFDIAPDWHWDLAWYLLELRVAIYDPKDNTLVAQAHSQQTSLARRSVEVIVARAMASLFNDNEEMEGEKRDESRLE